MSDYNCIELGVDIKRAIHKAYERGDNIQTIAYVLLVKGLAIIECHYQGEKTWQEHARHAIELFIEAQEERLKEGN
jgi:hypothetical protein